MFLLPMVMLISKTRQILGCTLMSMRDRNDLEQRREQGVAAWQKPSDFVYQAQISEDY